MLLPLSLWALETRRRWLAVAAIASVPLSGQVHLALGAILFFLVYAVVRRQTLVGAVGAAASAVAGLVVWLTEIRGTTGASGRPFAQVELYSAELLDFVTRHPRHGFETFVFLGWLVPLAALAGLVLLCAARTRARRRARARRARAVPARARREHAGVRAALERRAGSRRHARAVAVPADRLPLPRRARRVRRSNASRGASRRSSRSHSWRSTCASTCTGRWARTRGTPSTREVGPGPLLEQPVYLPELLEGSVYLYYAIQAPRERPMSYSTTAPPVAERAARELRSGRLDPSQLGVRWIVEFERGVPQRLIALR